MRVTRGECPHERGHDLAARRAAFDVTSHTLAEREAAASKLQQDLLARAETFEQRNAELEALSTADALTGIPNRRWLRQHALKRLERMTRGGSLTVALLDIDQFRRINEELGRQDADRALRHLVRIAGQRLHPGERLARLGRDEFALLLDCPVGTAWERMEQLRADLAAQPFLPGRGLDPVRLTVSAGLAAWPADGADLPALLGTADRRLQACRHSGGNRVAARDH